MELSETFWVTFITMGFAFVTGSLAYTLKSKCNSVRFCGGCIDIQRDVELEADIEENVARNSGQHQDPITSNEPTETAPRRASRESHNQSRLAQLVDFQTSMTESKTNKNNKL